MYIYIRISSFSYSYFSSCFMYRSFIGVGPRARAICASDDLFAVIKETKPTNDSDRLAILLNGVCLASHCHDDGELAGILWTHQARVHEAE